MKTSWQQIKFWINALFKHITGWHILFVGLIYCFFSYLFLFIAKETNLIEPFGNFVYYLLVTASTVGYGDFSPQSELGKYVVALFIIPIGLSIFALTVGHIASLIINFTRQGILGLRRVGVEDHILILGWNGQRTIHLIEMLLHVEKQRRAIVLCVRAEIENPLPKEIEFVRTVNFTHTLSMQNAGVEVASCIIIDNDEDDITFTAALFCAKVNPCAHILAYFHDEVLGNLLNTHCPNIECIPSVSVEMMAKSAIDPGSSVLHQELLNTKMGMTQYAVIYPKVNSEISVNEVFLKMKQEYDATLIGFRRNGETKLNPSLNLTILPNDILFYIASKRVTEFYW